MVDIPGYTIERELGRGGMATVYQAVQESVERRVALKVMSPVLLVDQTFSERFMREAKIAANLYHPNVVAIHDVGVFDDHHYIAMEYLSGGDLSERCQRRLELGDTIRITREIAGALDYAHSKGFVHRDVKPENILFREDDSAVLTDFGIARAVNSVTQMTKTGAVIGTPQYMSPEQARGKEVDGRSDLYGLGIVFYEMLTGAVPFEGGDSVAVGIKHVTEPIPQLPEYLQHIQPLLDHFLAKHPDQRYQKGSEAVAELKQLSRQIKGEQVAPVRSSQTESATRVSQASAAPTPTNSQATSLGVAATPRPDGKLRQEPVVGSLADIARFDRTVRQAAVSAPTAEPKRGGGRVWFVLALLGLIAAGAWWQRDMVLAWLPDSEVSQLLERAQQAADQGDWYGDTSEFASVLYRRVMQIDPGNRQARAGLELVALELAERAERALRTGNAAQASLWLERARDLAPGLPRLDRVAQSLSGAESAVDQAPPAADEGRVSDQIERLLAEAVTLMEADRWVRPQEDSALQRFRQVLSIDPAQETAAQGVAQIEAQLRAELDRAIANDTNQEVERLLADLALVLPNRQLDALQQEVAQQQARQRRQQEAAVQQARIESLLAQGDAALAADRLSRPPGNSAVDHYLRALELDPGEARARSGLETVANRYLSLAEIALEEDRLDQAEMLIDQIKQINPGISGLERAQRRLGIYRQQNERNRSSVAQQGEVETWLNQAQTALQQGDLMNPPGQSAYDSFKAVLRLSPQHPQALQGLRDLSVRLTAASGQALQTGDLEGALAALVDAEQIDPDNPAIAPLTVRLASALRRDARAAIAASELAQAATLLEQAARLQPGHADLERLQLELGVARDLANDQG